MIGSGKLTRARALLTATVAAGTAAAIFASAAGAVVLTPVGASSTKVVPGSRYLALGDSVTFGYQEPTVVPAPDYHTPRASSAIRSRSARSCGSRSRTRPVPARRRRA